MAKRPGFPQIGGHRPTGAGRKKTSRTEGIGEVGRLGRVIGGWGLTWPVTCSRGGRVGHRPSRFSSLVGLVRVRSRRVGLIGANVPDQWAGLVGLAGGECKSLGCPTRQSLMSVIERRGGPGRTGRRRPGHGFRSRLPRHALAAEPGVDKETPRSLLIAAGSKDELGTVARSRAGERGRAGRGFRRPC